METIKIDSQESAIYQLRKALMAHVADSDFQAIHFEGWPSLNIHLHGKLFDSSITTTIMKRLIDLQNSINQTYCLLTTGDSNTSCLTQEERSMLELVVVVKPGSSDFNIDLGEAFNKIIKTGVEKMNGQQIVAVILGLAVIYGTGVGVANYLEHRKQVRLAEIKSEEQTEFLKTINYANESTREAYSEAIQAITTVSKRVGPEVIDVANDSMNNLVKIAAASETAEIQGVSISQQAASLLVTNKRETSIEVRLDGEYFVENTNFTNPDGYLLKVKRLKDGLQLTADLQDGTLNEISKNILFDAMKDKRPVDLLINAKKIKDEIKNALIVDISKAREK